MQKSKEEKNRDKPWEWKQECDLCKKSATTQPCIGSPGFLFHIPGLSALLLLLLTLQVI